MRQQTPRLGQDVDHVRLESMIQKLAGVPFSEREYSIGPQQAARTFGLTPDLLGQLIEAGMPHARAGTRCSFAETDLHYIAMRLGTARFHLSAMRTWGRSLSKLSTEPATDLDISYRPSSGQDRIYDHPVPLSVSAWLPGGERREMSAQARPLVFQTTWRTQGAWPVLPPEVCKILERTAELDFCVLPRSLRHDTAVGRQSGLVDCATSARIVMEELWKIGVRARFRYGLMVALPFATQHYWSDVEIDGTWVPVDPVFIRFMSRFGATDPDEWPPSRSPGAFLVPIAGEFHPLLSCDGVSIETTLSVGHRPS